MFTSPWLRSLRSNFWFSRQVNWGRTILRSRPRLEELEMRCLLSGVSLPNSYGQLPLSFEVNEGQASPQVDYIAAGQGYGISLSKTAAILSFTGDDSASHTVAMQLVGKAFDESTLFRIAYAYEQHTEWHTRRPVLEVTA